MDEELYLWRENKGADQLCSYCTADLCLLCRLCMLLGFLCGGSYRNARVIVVLDCSGSMDPPKQIILLIWGVPECPQGIFSKFFFRFYENYFPEFLHLIDLYNDYLCFYTYLKQLNFFADISVCGHSGPLHMPCILHLLDLYNDYLCFYTYLKQLNFLRTFWSADIPAPYIRTRM